jgi:hypothetical protein
LLVFPKRVAKRGAKRGAKSQRYRTVVLVGEEIRVVTALPPIHPLLGKALFRKKNLPVG